MSVTPDSPQKTATTGGFFASVQNPETLCERRCSVLVGFLLYKYCSFVNKKFIGYRKVLLDECKN